MCITLTSYAQQKFKAQITVAQDGSGDYLTIQEAVNSVRDLGQQEVRILIKNGVYREKLVIPSWKEKISLIGENRDSTIITNGDYSGATYGGKTHSTFSSYTVLVEGNDFKAENLTIQNTAGRVGQAVALHVEGDRAVIKNCSILGNQDTLYTSKDGRNYFKDCFISGTTDFIFGEATVVFQNCTIKSLSDSYITAASTTKAQAFGYVFFNCKLTASDEATKVYLGRPWRPYCKTVFIDTEMGKHILKQGWDPWKGDNMFPEKEKTTLYAEYNSIGEGASPKTRVAWSKQLSKSERQKYTLQNIFSGWMPD